LQLAARGKVNTIYPLMQVICKKIRSSSKNPNLIYVYRPSRWSVKNWFSENCIFLFMWLL